MEQESIEPHKPETVAEKRDYFLPASILLSALIVGGVWMYVSGAKTGAERSAAVQVSHPAIPAEKSTEIPAAWGDLGKKMIDAGVIDRAQFMAVSESRGGLSDAEVNLLDGTDNGTLRITSANAGTLLNLLWALGLGNKNLILERGPMADARYGGAGNFASTGGWTLAQGNAMNHYGAHPLIPLTEAQQTLVERVSKNIYRPCCDNATHFPDCNHGMAMLGLMELMASQGATETEMYKTALIVHSYWFPEQYAVIARYLESKGVAPQSADPKEILGSDYSSGSGFRRIMALTPSQPENRGGGSCGV